MLRDRYKALYDDITPSDELVSKMIKTSKRKRPVIILVAAIMIMILPALVFAAEPDILYYIAPSIAQSMKPVMMTSEDQGITMTVISASIEEDEANVLIKFKGLENSLKKKFDTYDSYYIKGPFDSSGHIEFIEYDNESKEAVYLVNIGSMSGDYLPKHKITFGFTTLLLNQIESLDVVLPIDLSRIEDAEIQSDVRISGEGGTGDLKDKSVIQSHMNETFEGKDVIITGVGLLNDQLHIQLKYNNRIELDNHGTLRLNGPDGIMDYNKVIYFVNDEGDFAEYIFDVSEDNIAEYEVRGDFYVYSSRVDGEWEVTFKLNE